MLFRQNKSQLTKEKKNLNNEVVPLELTVQQIDEFKRQINEIVIQEKVPQNNQKIFVDAFVKSIETYSYMSQNNNADEIIAAHKRESTPYVIECKKRGEEINRKLTEIGYPKESEEYKKIYGRILLLPLYKEAIENLRLINAKGLLQAKEIIKENESASLKNYSRKMS